MDYALGDPRQHRGRWGHPEQSGSRGARRAARAL